MKTIAPRSFFYLFSLFLELLSSRDFFKNISSNYYLPSGLFLSALFGRFDRNSFGTFQHPGRHFGSKSGTNEVWMVCSSLRRPEKLKEKVLETILKNTSQKKATLSLKKITVSKRGHNNWHYDNTFKKLPSGLYSSASFKRLNLDRISGESKTVEIKFLNGSKFVQLQIVMFMTSTLCCVRVTFWNIYNTLVLIWILW